MKWERLVAELLKMKRILLHRCYFYNISEKVISSTIHGFCDASRMAYAAVTYVVIRTVSSSYVGFLASKTRVADNVKDQLKSLGITGTDQTAFSNAIFGYVEDDVYHEGLVNLTDDALFDAALASLEEWNKKELELNPNSDEAKFYSWIKRGLRCLKNP